MNSDKTVPIKDLIVLKDDYEESEDATFNDEFTSTVFKEEAKFVRSTRKPNIHVANSTFRYSTKQGIGEPKKSIYDPVSSSDEDAKEVDQVNHLAEQRNKNIPKGRGYVVQKFEKLRKVGDDMDEITNDIRQIYPLGHTEDIIVAKLKNSSPEKHVPKKIDNHPFVPVLSNKKQQQTFEEDNSTSTSSSYGPYVPLYEQKPNLSDGNEFPSLSLGKKPKQHGRKDNTKTSSGASYNRKFRPAKKLNLKDVSEFPNL